MKQLNTLLQHNLSKSLYIYPSVQSATYLQHYVKEQKAINESQVGLM